MKSGSRANVVSSFTVVKGAMNDETYAVFAALDFERSKRENLDRLREENFIGAKSATWLRDVAKVLNRRFDPGGRDRPLVVLAKHGLPVDEWKSLLLWHMTRDLSSSSAASSRPGCSPPTRPVRFASASTRSRSTSATSASEAAPQSTSCPSRPPNAWPRAAHGRGRCEKLAGRCTRPGTRRSADDRRGRHQRASGRGGGVAQNPRGVAAQKTKHKSATHAKTMNPVRERCR